MASEDDDDTLPIVPKRVLPRGGGPAARDESLTPTYASRGASPADDERRALQDRAASRKARVPTRRAVHRQLDAHIVSMDVRRAHAVEVERARQAADRLTEAGDLLTQAARRARAEGKQTRMFMLSAFVGLAGVGYALLSLGWYVGLW